MTKELGGSEHPTSGRASLTCVPRIISTLRSVETQQACNLGPIGRILTDSKVPVRSELFVELRAVILFR